MAQLSSPVALNFSDAVARDPLDRDTLILTGSFYIELLRDLGTLVGHCDAFRLSPWIASARALASRDAAGSVQRDCFSPTLANKTDSGCCSKFFEWNARCQITTWCVLRN